MANQPDEPGHEGDDGDEKQSRLNVDGQAQGGERHRGDADEGTPSGGDAKP